MKLNEIFDHPSFREPKPKKAEHSGTKYACIQFEDDDYYNPDSDEESKEVFKFFIHPIDASVENGYYYVDHRFYPDNGDGPRTWAAYVDETPAKAFNRFKTQTLNSQSWVPRFVQVHEYANADRDVADIEAGKWYKHPEPR